MALTDAAVAHQALEYRRLKAAASALEAEAKVCSDAVVAELARRKFPVDEKFVHRGLEVSVVATRRTRYRVADVRRLVGRSAFARVTELVVVNTAMAAEIKAGRIDAEVIAAAADVTTAKPYIVVTGDAA
jgi:hypothetical protein